MMTHFARKPRKKERAVPLVFLLSEFPQTTRMLRPLAILWAVKLSPKMGSVSMPLA